MDTWEDVKSMEPGDEARVTTKSGNVHGQVFAVDAATKTITFVNAAGQKVPVKFDAVEPEKK